MNMKKLFSVQPVMRHDVQAKQTNRNVERLIFQNNLIQGMGKVIRV